MLRIFIICAFMVTVSCLSTPYMSKLKNVLLIGKVVQLKNESSTDPRVAVNLMFIHFKSALTNGNLTEVDGFFQFLRDADKLLKPTFKSLRGTVGRPGVEKLFSGMSFSALNCRKTMFMAKNTTTCDVIIRFPWQTLTHRRQLKTIEVMKDPKKAHNLYSNGYQIVSINREWEEKWATAWMDEYNENMKRMKEQEKEQREQVDQWKVVLEEDEEEQEYPSFYV